MEMIRNTFDLANLWLTEQFGDLGPVIVVGVLGVLLIVLVGAVLLLRWIF